MMLEGAECLRHGDAGCQSLPDAQLVTGYVKKLKE